MLQFYFRRSDEGIEELIHRLKVNEVYTCHELFIDCLYKLCVVYQAFSSSCVSSGSIVEFGSVPCSPKDSAAWNGISCGAHHSPKGHIV